MFTPQTEAFIERIHQDIPLTQAMGWQIESIQNDRLIATAPLLPNINDKGTFFGGASAALMTISAWSLIKYNLEQRSVQNDVVIHKSKNKWLRPQTDEIKICCQFDEDVNWCEVKERVLSQKQTQHLKVNIQGLAETCVTCTMSANYVILPFK